VHLKEYSKNSQILLLFMNSDNVEFGEFIEFSVIKRFGVIKLNRVHRANARERCKNVYIRSKTVIGIFQIKENKKEIKRKTACCSFIAIKEKL